MHRSSDTPATSFAKFLDLHVILKASSQQPLLHRVSQRGNINRVSSTSCSYVAEDLLVNAMALMIPVVETCETFDQRGELKREAHVMTRELR